MMSPFGQIFAVVGSYALPNGTEPFVFLDLQANPIVVQVDSAEVALATVLAENADFGAYSPSDIQAGVGLVDSQPVFIGDALNLILSGSTIVCTFTIPAVADGRVDFEMIDSTDYNLDIQVFSSNNNGCNLDDNAGHTAKEPGLAPGTNKIAVTLIDGKIARSTNGNPVRLVDPSVAWSPAPEVMLLGAGGDAVIESVGLYPAQAVADLPALSDLGYPVNTVAPVITGTAQMGQTLSVSQGTWVGAVSYTYQWFGASFNTDAAIPGATGTTYLVDDLEVDEGMFIRCRVSATNATGTSTVGVVDNDAVIAA